MFGQEYQAGRAWNPWRELERFQEDVNRLFATGARETFAPGAPRVNVWAGEEGARVTAMLPGVSPESLDVSVLGERLTLRGKRAPEQLKEGEAYHRRERTDGEFTRVVELPFRVDSQKVVATYTRGVLEVFLPRSPEDKPRRIAVKPA